MQCTLFYNPADAIVMDKDDVLQPIRPIDSETDSFNIEITSDSSVENPTFILSAPTRVMEANYMYVPDLSRFYYLGEKTMSQGKIIVQAHVDVLNSYKAYIAELYVMLNRQEQDENFNLYLQDDMPFIDNPNNVRTIPFGGSFNESSSFLLIIAGSDS